jgi:hypothetical protein
MVGIAGATAVASTAVPGGSGHRLTYSGADNELLIVGPSGAATYAIPPTTLYLPIFASVPVGGEPVELEDVTVLIQGKSQTVPAGVWLDPQQFTADEIVQALDRGGAEAASMAKSGWYEHLAVDVRSLQLKEGDVVPVEILAHANVGGSPVTVGLAVEYSVLSLPIRTNWYGGDGHVHTEWSLDMWEESIDERAAYAANNGHKWIVITDHEDGINDLWSATPNGYVAQCNAAQAGHGIPVCPGAEIATTAATDSHALGYALKETAATIPDNQALVPQSLIDVINAHNSPTSYTVIAHPYHGTYPWDDWTVTGFRSMELLCYETAAKTQTIDKWFSLLRNGLSSTISTGKFVVGIGTSDCHVGVAPGDVGFTWVYTTSYGSSNRSAIWTAIRTGRVSASGLKDLGCFSLNNYAQGSVINVNPASTLTFKLVQQPVTGRKCTKITVYNKNQAAIKTLSNPSSTETTWTMTAGSSDEFYVVKFDFTTTSGTNPSQVWANPIFVNVP